MSLPLTTNETLRSFGSDWPHPEGLQDPITFVDDLAELSQEEQAMIMGGNMMKLFKIPSPVPA